MTERPILMSPAMVRAILAGRKKQTRRVIKPQPPDDTGYRIITLIDSTARAERSKLGAHHWVKLGGENDLEIIADQGKYFRCPYGAKGDRLWVRETCNISETKDAVMYLDNGGKLGPDAPPNSESWARQWKTLPSIFMPRWASRITLEVINIRVQRLQDISGEDAVKEGVELKEDGYWCDGHFHASDARIVYESLWESINSKNGHSWESNPWVWVIDFEVAKS